MTWLWQSTAPAGMSGKRRGSLQACAEDADAATTRQRQLRIHVC
jgi:hypothetical protein